MTKQTAIAHDVLRLDVQDIYKNHVEGESLDFLTAMLEEGIIRFYKAVGEETGSIIVRGLLRELKT